MLTEDSEDFSGRKIGIYITHMMKEEAEDFSENLAPTRLLSCKKRQKIYLENWHFHDYVDGKSRKFLW
jgi:hypothetical protein